MLDRAEATQVLQIVDVDMPVVDLIAALSQQIADHVLARPLGAAGRGNRDEISCGRKLGVEAGVDGIEDLPLRIGSHAAAPIENLRVKESGHPSPVSAAGVSQKIGISQGFFEQTTFRISTQ